MRTLPITGGGTGNTFTEIESSVISVVNHSAPCRDTHDRDHHGQGAGRVTVLFRVVDAILGTHKRS